VLVIITDDQRSGLSVMPFTRKWFVNGGTRYPRAFANTPLCCPARASIMTGLYAHNHGVLNNQSGANLDQDATIQNALHEAGYRTALFGKFLNRWELTTPPPHFDRWSVYSNQLDGEVFTNPTYYGGLWNVDGAMKQVAAYSTRFVGRRATAFLRDQELEDDRPWFMFVTPNAPHPPSTPETAYADAPVSFWPGSPATSEADLSDKPPWWQTRGMSQLRGRTVRIKQYRALMSVDDLVERIAKTLGQLDEARSTFALFVSDNGYLWAEHGRWGKTLPYDGSVRVPMFLRWPRHVPSGVIDRRLVAHVDIAPTIRAAAGLAPDSSHPLDGRSLLDLGWDRDRLLLEYFPSAGSITPAWASTWTPKSQYIEYYDPANGEVSFRELYDLRNDPWQLDNRYADRNLANDPSEAETAALGARLGQDRVCAAQTCP
jgi:arylsulfatase A-like enzyme